MEEMNMKKRPTLVTIIAIFFLLLGGLSLLWSALVFGLGGLTSAFSGLIGADNMTELGNSGVWSGFFGILAAGVQIAVGIGLLKMASWSWYLTILAVGISMFEGVIGMFGSGAFVFLCSLFWLLIPLGVFIYLLRPSMRELFGVRLGNG